MLSPGLHTPRRDLCRFGKSHWHRDSPAWLLLPTLQHPWVWAGASTGPTLGLWLPPELDLCAHMGVQSPVLHPTSCSDSRMDLRVPEPPLPVPALPPPALPWLRASSARMWGHILCNMPVFQRLQGERAQGCVCQFSLPLNQNCLGRSSVAPSWCWNWHCDSLISSAASALLPVTHCSMIK